MSARGGVGAEGDDVAKADPTPGLNQPVTGVKRLWLPGPSVAGKSLKSSSRISLSSCPERPPPLEPGALEPFYWTRPVLSSHCPALVIPRRPIIPVSSPAPPLERTRKIGPHLSSPSNQEPLRRRSHSAAFLTIQSARRPLAPANLG